MKKDSTIYNSIKNKINHLKLKYKIKMTKIIKKQKILIINLKNRKN